ncbi:hypothetical protein Clacol_003216 [Clathrus columnatus]|uniref:Uncharacterized protein n=1 Tax=Clathrus columnatus TaxID=1419009 RepID=A0AAV5AAN5_9AGAM|nr:hypothetical protein Clacol_003216 [Clathrus columnatus]
MSRYLCMRWSELPEVLPWHAHEAFKRLLLKQIIQMTNDNCSIPIHGPRPPLPKYGFNKLSTTNRSQVPSQTGTSTYRLNTSEPQSLGSKRRQNLTPTDSEPPPKKPRHKTQNDVEENPDPLAKFVQNLANDVLCTDCE